MDRRDERRELENSHENKISPKKKDKSAICDGAKYSFADLRFGKKLH